LIVVFGVVYYIQHKTDKLLPADISTSNPSRLEGFWAFKEENPIKYSGSYISEFCSDGRIIGHDYKKDWKLGDKIETKEIGWWKADKNVVWIKYYSWDAPYNYYFTIDNILVPFDDTGDTSWKLLPVKIIDGMPKINHQ